MPTAAVQTSHRDRPLSARDVTARRLFMKEAILNSEAPAGRKVWRVGEGALAVRRPGGDGGGDRRVAGLTVRFDGRATVLRHAEQTSPIGRSAG